MAPPRSPGSGPAPVIVIKKKSGHGGHGHHGGAWKVAYADFVTAMMAFFLLLWLLSITTKEQKQAIANYFDPTSTAETTSGSGGVLGGTSMMSPGAEMSEQKPISSKIPVPGDEAEASDTAGKPNDSSGNGTQSGIGDAEKAKAAAAAEAEDKNFKQVEASIRQAIESVPEMKSMSQNLLVDETPEGLRIQLIDQEGSSMFPSGSNEMYDKTKKLLATVAHIVQKLPNQITIRGHTDSTPYHSAKGYNNWDLSSDRANASRRALVDAGLDPSKIASVIGKADKEPLFKENPAAPENRRISVVLLRASVSAASGDSDAAIGHVPAKPDGG
jgi:chemotaxis protein MotB